jgi:lipopolysaccharide export system protein LptA
MNRIVHNQLALVRRLQKQLSASCRLKQYGQAVLAIIYGLCIHTHLMALPADKNQPYKITADSVLYDRKAHRTIYTGRVKASQGSTKVTADRLVVISSAGTNQIVELIATGKLAHYSTLPEPGGHRLFAEAKTIRFWPGQQKAQLLEKGKVTQNNNIFTGGEIWYDLAQQTVRATKGKAQQANHVTTTIIIQPDQKTGHG